MDNGLSAADVMAMTRDNGGEWMNNPFIYLVWLALLGNGGIFGGNRDVNQGSLTRAELYDGFNYQGINERLGGIQSGICDGFYAQNTSILQGFNTIGNQIAENRFAAQDCCCKTQAAIADLKAEGYKNTCAITNAIQAEGQATRALINANTMQDLRDKLEERDRQLLTSNLFSAQQNQTQNIIAALRPFPQPAYITCSPYSTTSNVTCGCGC